MDLGWLLVEAIDPLSQRCPRKAAHSIFLPLHLFFDPSDGVLIEAITGCSVVDSKTITRPRRPHATILPEATPETPHLPAMGRFSSRIHRRPCSGQFGRKERHISRASCCQVIFLPFPFIVRGILRDERRPRQRQATMTMQSNLVQAIHEAFQKAQEVRFFAHASLLSGESWRRDWRGRAEDSLTGRLEGERMAL